ncbi:MAG: IS200/IS605 family transposase [Ignavibacterium sp.]|jgi:REP element-mobilizing transposase RayT|nr:IS200/IS605 family transposase [Ignavibacterium sp.]
MPFVKIWIHIVFGTKNREPFLVKDVREKVISHIIENAKTKGIFIDCINGFNDHLHVLISLGKEENIAKVVNLIKGEVSHWINKNKITRTKFEWADEYFAVSVSESQVNVVRNYIANQERHHSKRSYSEEYEEFVRRYGFKYLG